jgi:hypothetical protein
MWVGRTSVRPPDAERTQEEARSAAEPPAAELLLRLQRAGGNQAVARLIRASAAPRRVLARFGVQVLVGDKMAVEGIQVHGRPKERLIPGAEGSHVTAWAVFADLVRRKLVGLDAPAALTAARGLLAGQIASLGVDWPDPKPKVVEDGIGEAQEVVDAIDAGGGGGVEISQLQEAIAQYLRLHNLRRGTAVLIGKAQAIGAGEPGLLSTLRLHEGGSAQPPKALRDAMFGLLDVRALKFIGGLTGPSAAAPGIDATDADRVGRSVVRGLQDLADAYPRSYKKAITKSHVERWLGSEGLPKALPGGLPAAATTAAAPAGWSRTSADAIKAEVNKRTALCQIVLDAPEAEEGGDGEDLPDATDAVVREVITAGRPRTLFKSDQGHHAVAFKLESMRLDALRGETLSEAATILKEMATEAIGDIKAALTALDDEDSQADEFDESRSDYSSLVLTSARDELQGLVDTFDPDATDAARLVLDVQELAGSWMRAVAVLPLATADVGGPAGGKGEGKAIAVLKGYEVAAKGKKRLSQTRTAEARENLIKLLDMEAIGWLHDDESTGLGYPESGDERVGLILRRWLRAANDAFPNAYEDTGIGTADQLRPIVERLKLRLDAKQVVQIALELEEPPDWIDEERDLEGEDVWSGGEDEPKKRRKPSPATPKAHPKKKKAKRRAPVKGR